jgi:hypothetical protein
MMETHTGVRGTGKECTGDYFHERDFCYRSEYTGCNH